jgi:hypothetical protein
VFAVADAEIQDVTNPPSHREVRAFVGPRAGYYLDSWRRALDGDGGASGFNVAAFFLSGLWLGYRKMYAAVFTLFAVLLVESVLELVLFVGVLKKEDTPSGMNTAVSLAVAVVVGGYGNRWYLARARRAIADVRARGLPEDEHLDALAARGGTSIISAVGVFALFLAVGFAVNFGVYYALTGRAD